MSYPVPLSTADWARVRYEYECTSRKVADICAEHRISNGTLRDRVRRWGWKRRWSGPVPREGPPPIAIPMLAFMAPVGAPLDLRFGGDEPRQGGEVIPLTAALPATPAEAEQDGRERPVGHDARPTGARLQGAIAQVMPALETTLSSLAAGPMQPRQMEQAARALGALTRTLRELNGLVADYPVEEVEDVEALRAELKRRIDAAVEEEREAGLRYLAGWEQFELAVHDAALL